MTMEVTASDARMIHTIATEVIRQAGNLKPLDVAMDLTAVHANGNPLRLADMVIDAKTSLSANLLHDVYGIHRHLDRRTGRLMDCFVPRYSQQ